MNLLSAIDKLRGDCLKLLPQLPGDLADLIDEVRDKGRHTSTSAKR